MSQINLKKSPSFSTPPADNRGWGFTADGVPVIITEDGTPIPLLTDIAISILGIVANSGVGLASALPTVGAGKVYVSTDSLLVYTPNEAASAWESRSLILGEFVTDTTVTGNVLYQYLSGLGIIGGMGIVGFQEFSATAGQTIFVITDFVVVERSVMLIREGTIPTQAQITDVTNQSITISPAALEGTQIMFKQ